MSIEFVCKKCGHAMRADADEKAGRLFACRGCEAITRCPGIANQQRATESQVAAIALAAQRHRKMLKWAIGIWTAYVLFPLVLILLAASPLLSVLVLVFFAGGLIPLVAVALLAQRVAATRTCLYGPASTLFTYIAVLFLWFPIGLVLSIMSYLRVRARLTTLRDTECRVEHGVA